MSEDHSTIIPAAPGTMAVVVAVEWETEDEYAPSDGAFVLRIPIIGWLVEAGEHRGFFGEPILCAQQYDNDTVFIACEGGLFDLELRDICTLEDAITRTRREFDAAQKRRRLHAERPKAS